jgi:hypothetical protein
MCETLGENGSAPSTCASREEGREGKAQEQKVAGWCKQQITPTTLAFDTRYVAAFAPCRFLAAAVQANLPEKMAALYIKEGPQRGTWL